MSARERVRLIRNLNFVDMAIESIDQDKSVCQTLRLLHPDAFANGGDQTSVNVPEKEICDELGAKMVDGLGEKVQSSRWLVRDLLQNCNENAASEKYFQESRKPDDLPSSFLLT